MNADKLKDLQIPAEAKHRSQSSTWTIFLSVVIIAVGAAYFAWPKPEDERRIIGKDGEKVPSNSPKVGGAKSNAPATPAKSPSPGAPAKAEGSVLTVSGYIICRERIALSPRFMGVVKWIGVKKGDAVTNGQVVVQLDDAENKARVAEADARIANAKTALATAQFAVPDSEARLAQAEARLASTRASLSKAELDFQRAEKLVEQKAEAKQVEDDARLRLEAARATWREAEALVVAARLAPGEARARLNSAQASVREAEATRGLAQLYLDWTTIRSPINGVVLEKLVNPDELVVPQSFGGTRGPSTALIAVADPTDLQVEIDLNEADLSKVFLKQKCRVSPEAYPDKTYDGVVAEIAPEAARQKGTLQVKVQIRNPDRYLTPELSAKVDFLGAPTGTGATNEAKSAAAK